jgi:xylulokinase
VLQAKDYVAFRHTGVMATDYSDASGTNLFDLRARRWSEPILEQLHLEPSLLPPAVPSATVIGEVTTAAADETGLMAGTPVVIGGGDGACATAGAGVVRPFDAYNYIGSSSWISYVSTEPLLDPMQRTFTFAHLDPAYLFPTGTMQCAGGSYDWLEALLRGNADGRLYAELDALATGVPVGSRGLLLPAVPDRRAQPALEPACPRGLCGPHHGARTP